MLDVKVSGGLSIYISVGKIQIGVIDCQCGEAVPPSSALTYSDKLAEYWDEQFSLRDNNTPPPQAIKPNLTPVESPVPLVNQRASPESVSPPSSQTARKKSNRHKTRSTQADAVLLRSLGPQHPDVARVGGERPLSLGEESEAGDSGDDMDGTEEGPTTSEAPKDPDKESLRHLALQVLSSSQDASKLEAQSSLETQQRSYPKDAIIDRTLTNNNVPAVAAETLLTLKDDTSPRLKSEMHSLRVGSPIHRENGLPPFQPSKDQKLAAIHPTSFSNGESSGKQERPSLPGMREVGLTEAAQCVDDVANGRLQQNADRRYQQAHSPYNHLDHRSPQSAYSRPSPHEGYRKIGDANSPQSHAPSPYYGRKPSHQPENNSYSTAPPAESPYPTAPSTSNEPSSVEAFSPSIGSTPGDRMDLDGQNTRQARQNQQQPVAPGGMGYKCDNPGCTAPPFQTQYLLNSHKNVHSQARPHYCTVPGCNRGEGGRGFKRKNEMIRHGLVHSSPGYICPFCPDKEHKYPRPDNLQRYVLHILCSLLLLSNDDQTCPSSPPG